jgi:hypothetical protein
MWAISLYKESFADCEFAWLNMPVNTIDKKMYLRVDFMCLFSFDEPKIG